MNRASLTNVIYLLVVVIVIIVLLRFLLSLT